MSQLLLKSFLSICSLVLSLTLSFAQGKVSGTVKDDNGNPVIGATVVVKGTTVGAVSDVDGKYAFEAPAGEQEITASFVGYKTVTQKINITQGGNTQLDFTLQEDAMGLDEIVVTGSFSSRSQKDSPISITLLNSKQLATAGFNSQADILRAIPGITAEGGGGEVASNVFVRGMPSGGQYQFTPLQVDGLPTISTFGLNSSAHDVYFRNDIGIRNLEFIRGGASTLFGAGSVAGIINYTSVTGTAQQQNKIGLEWAQNGRVKVDFLTAGPMGKDLFYAFSGFYRYDEGPIKTGLVTRGYQLRGNVRKMFNKGNSSFTVYTQLIDDNVQFYLPYPLQNDNGTFSRPTGNDGKKVFTLLTGNATDFSFDTPNGRFESPIENGVITKGGYIMGDLQHSFGEDWLLQAKVKAANYDHWFNLFLDGDGVHNVPETQANYLTDRNLQSGTFTYADNGTTLAASDLVFENRVLDRQRPMQELAGEFNLSKKINTGSLEHNITVGTYLSYTRAEDNNWIWNFLGDFSNSPRMVNLVGVDTAGNNVTYATNGFIRGSQTANRYHQSSKSAIYIADEIRADKFTLDVGVRWERALGVISREVGIGTNSFERGEVSASDFAVVLAGLYRLNDQINVYANASRGYFFPELRGVRFLAPGVPQSYETEKINQAEIGVKYGSKKLSATVAGFFVGLNDRRSIDFVNDGQGGVVEQVFTQSTQTLGVEGTATYQVISGLSLNTQLTYQEHQFTKVEGNTDLEGNRLRRQPLFKGSLGLNYNKNRIDFNASMVYLGQRYANDANTVQLDPYSLVRVGAGYTFNLDKQGGTLRLGVSIFNLLDSEGVTEGSPRQGNTQVGTASFFVGRPILPRRIALRALFEF
ncbi:hypothetical protein BKI52_07350 [marine bacterium AO1-C]|nr:hypothetical protein BKI52_07350 [marine bacterium AO1-C]